MLAAAAGKHFAVFGGMFKSHHIAQVPLIEALLEKGHEVSFVIPNTTDSRSWFPQGIGRANMVYLGNVDWSLDTMFAGPEFDFKNLPWYERPAWFPRVMAMYRKELDKPLFSMHDELVEWIKKPGIDAALLHAADFASKVTVRAAGIPWVSFLSAPPLPFFMIDHPVARKTIFFAYVR